MYTFRRTRSQPVNNIRLGLLREVVIGLLYLSSIIYSLSNLTMDGRNPLISTPTNSVDEQLDPSYTPKLLKATGVSIADHADFENEPNSAKILVLYCGGTIGMKSTSGGMLSRIG